MLTGIYLVVALGLVFLAAELFTNAVEWFGKRLNVNEGAVGSVLAALGTALPETSVAIVAIFLGGHERIEAGIGAILGAPLMLSTLGMLLTGGSVLLFAARGIRKREIKADHKVIGSNLRYFFLVYFLAVAAAPIPVHGIKLAIAAVLALIYLRYAYRTLTCADSDPERHSMRPLHFHRVIGMPKLRWVITQLASSLALMLFGAKLFVDNVVLASSSLGVSPIVLSVMITPIATELPEVFNSVTWIRHKKDTLALGNVTGAMVFQSSIPPAIGLIFTPWRLDTVAYAAISVALLASLVAWGDITLRKKLSPYSLIVAGTLYLLYPLLVFAILPAMQR